jgi:hypothetical protein
VTHHVICTYLVKPACVDEFAALLRDHWPALQRADLVTDFRPLHFRRDDEEGKPVLVEIFEWKTADSSSAAHANPAVAGIWKRMEVLVEDRGDRPKWRFSHYARLDPGS